jgi:hypothetical protein
MEDVVFVEKKSYASILITRSGDVLTAVVKNEYPYIGLIMNKRAVMYISVLREFGFTDEVVSVSVSPCRDQTAKMLLFDDGPQKFDVVKFIQKINQEA